MKFYVAHAFRHTATHEDILKERVYDSYEKAKDNLLYIDDDDSCVLVFIDSNWWRIWDRLEDDDFLVSTEYGGFNTSVPMKHKDEYMQKFKEIENMGYLIDGFQFALGNTNKINIIRGNYISGNIVGYINEDLSVDWLNKNS